MPWNRTASSLVDMAATDIGVRVKTVRQISARCKPAVRGRGNRVQSAATCKDSRGEPPTACSRRQPWRDLRRSKGSSGRHQSDEDRFAEDQVEAHILQLQARDPADGRGDMPPICSLCAASRLRFSAIASVINATPNAEALIELRDVEFRYGS